MQQKTKHAEIAGAGFAGLVAAAALAQRGWSVRVHEKAPELRAFGAGIYLWYNGLRALESIDALDQVMSESVTPPFYETRVHNVTVSKEWFNGLAWRTMTRQHLHQALVSAARRHGAEIVTNSEVVSADPGGSLTLASNETLRADLVIGADGVTSRVRDSIGFRQERQKSRDGVIRLLVPRLKDELGPGDWDNMIDFWNFEPRVLRVLYVPCNERELYLALMAPRADKEGSHVPILPEVWTEIFPHLSPVLKAAAQQDGRYDRYETTVVKEWTCGRVALIGDAAHAMCPALAQGAGLGMVNALTVAKAVEGDVDIPDSLKDWEKRMRAMTDRCQALSAEYAATRGMSRGNQFTPSVLEAARYDPIRNRVLDPLTLN